MRSNSKLYCGSLIAILAAGGACSSGEGPSPADSVEVVGRARQAVVQAAAMSISVPSTSDFKNVAVGAAGTLLFGDRAQLLQAAGGFAESTTTGTAKARYGFTVKVGSITAAGPVEVMNNANIAGSIRAGGAVTFGINATPTPGPASVTVSGTITSSAAVIPRALSWSVPFNLVTTSRTITTSTTLAPGSYGSVNIQSGTVTLQAGTYYIDSLTLEPNATISVNASAGPVYVYIRTSFIDHGNWSTTAPENVLLGYFGSQLLALERPFAGTVVAPNARVRFAVGGTPHTGSVFAKEVELDPDVKFTFKPFSRWDGLIPDLTKDSDCDGAPDALEVAASLNPNDPADGSLDPDADGIPSKEELVVGGNPKAADSDNDGIADPVDLIAQTDLDGDGKVHASDNCPTKTNPGQQDADGDGIGDVCDPTPTAGETTALVQLALYRSPTGDAALAPPGNFDTQRLRTDLKGLYASDASLLAFEKPFGTMSRVFEMWHPAGAHAYAISAAEKSNLLSRGYRELGTLGYFPTAAPSLGIPVQVRRFSKTIAGLESQAFATTAAAATALTSEGFTEIAAIGYGLQDQGALVKSTLVVRYKDAANHYHYRFNALSEVNRVGWTSTGRQFRVFVRSSPWTVPLYRLMNSAGVEALALASELASFQAQGYSLRGVLGHVYPATGPLENTEATQVLKRVTGTGKETVYTSNPTEIQTLLANGYTSAVALVRVVALRGLDLYREGKACVGEKSVDQRIRNAFGADNPTKRSGKTLSALATACTLKRLTSTTSNLSADEQSAKTKLGTLDPMVVQTARTQADRILSLTAAERAALLGPLKALDPGACVNPVDWKRTGPAVTQTLAGTAPGGTNGGTTGGADPRSLVKIRAPQCQGVTYAAGDRAVAGEAARAVTAVEVGAPSCGPEICSDTAVGILNPKVYGVLSGGRALPAGGALDQWAKQHPDVGVPVSGIYKNSDCSTCAASLGESCVAGQCRSYPVVANHTMIRLTGANFWDLKTARLRLTRVSTGEVLPDSDMVGLQVDPIASNAELPARCDFAPVAQGQIGVLNGPPIGCPAPCVSPFDRSIRPNEKFVEEMDVLISVPDTKVNDFYTVQVVNFNGSYIPRNEPVPFDLAELAAKGRSVHVCAGPSCTPIPSETNAACSLIGMPNCGGAVGGGWTTPPRSLSECKALRDASGDPTFQCPETPFTFVSAPAVSSIPMRVFVTADQPKFVQTRLSKVLCNSETGWHWPGDDELVVVYGGVSLPTLAVGDVEAATDVYQATMGEGDARFPEKKFTSIRSDLTDSAAAAFLFQAGEDDDIGFNMIAVTVLSAALSAGTAGLGGAAVLGIVAAGASGGVGGFIAAYTGAGHPWLDPDDFIGRDGWYANSNTVSLLGVQSHSAPLDPLASFPQTDDRRDVSKREGGKHPAVDGSCYNFNTEVLECTSASQCNGSRPLCTLGACVKSNWTDKSLPVPFNSTTDAAGTMEYMRFNGDADYEFWVSTSVTGQQF